MLVFIIISVVIGIIIINYIYRKKCDKIQEIFKDGAEKYPDIDINYKLTMDKLKYTGCMKNYEKSSDKCESLSPCIRFIPYFCSENGRRHYADDYCKEKQEGKERNDCVSNMMSKIHVYKTINCNEVNKLSPFPISI
jgi:hypothetical protein